MPDMAKNALCAAFIALLSAFATPDAMAQSSEGERELRELQARQFRAMFDDPDNLEKMFAYSQTSIRLKDYEAAISTLDRILIYNPDQPRVKLELGAAYYRIGSYTIARFYFDEVRNDPKTPEDLLPRVQAFLDEIDNRTAESSVSGVVSLNFIATDNANNGPDSPFIDFQGVLVQLGDPQATSQSDIGGSVSVSLTHVYDLGGTNADAWRTNLAYYSARFEGTPNGAADVLVLRTGPQLSLDDERYGPKIRPYVEIDHIRSGLDPLYSTIGVGAEFTDTLSESSTLLADARIGYRDFSNDGDKGDPTDLRRELDRVSFRGNVGLLYFYDDQTILRGVLGAEVENAGSDEESSAEVSVTGAVSYSYDSGFAFADRRWVIGATAQATYREHFEFDAVPQVRRKDFDLRLGLSHTAFVGSGVGLTLKADYFLRESNSRNFDLDSLTLTAGVSYFF